MIPKIIHLCWLSGDSFPKDIAVCLESWKHHFKDYEIWLWGKKPKDCLGLNIVEKHFDLDSVVWCKQAFEAKKYAFAADYIRLYALYNFGGIYMDSDVVVYKSFNDLLHLPYFIGEDYVHCFEPAIIGCESKTAWIKDVLDRYEGLAFVKEDGSYNMRGLPVVFHDCLSKKYSFQKTKGNDIYSRDSKVIHVFPSNYFNSRDHCGVIKTPNSYCAHNYAGSWLENKKGGLNTIRSIIPRILLNVIYRLYFGFHQENIRLIQIPF